MKQEVNRKCDVEKKQEVNMKNRKETGSKQEMSCRKQTGSMFIYTLFTFVVMVTLYQIKAVMKVLIGLTSKAF